MHFYASFLYRLFGTQNKEVSYGAANPDGLCLAWAYVWEASVKW